MNQLKASMEMQFAGSQKERKNEANLENDRFGGAGKCDETWSEVKILAGNTVRWKCFTSALCS
jgi:hypothetical protein